MLWSAFCLAGGLYGLYAIATGVALVLESASWPTASGTVTHSKLITSGILSSEHQLRYAYQVDATIYAGRNITFAGRILADSARDNFERYPEGHEVSVHYYPGNPVVSVLEPELRWGRSLMVLAASVLLCTVGMRGIRARYLGRR